MYSDEVLFAQLMDFLPRHDFNKCVQRYRGNARVRGFSYRDQFLCMAFAQLTYRESLRDIETHRKSSFHDLLLSVDSIRRNDCLPHNLHPIKSNTQSN